MKTYSLLLMALLLFYSCNEEGPKDISEKKLQKDANLALPAFTDTTACIFSEIAYCSDPQPQLDKYLPGWKVVWNPLPVSGNHAFVASDGNAYVIAFRGSLISFSEDAFNNWIYHDLNVAVQDKWPYSDEEKSCISQGSYIGWQNLQKMKDKMSGQLLWDFLSEKVGDQNPLTLTGHSLGGNLAMVSASWLWWKFNEAKRPKNNINVISFAAPAPGNKAFAKDFNNKFPSSVRIENANDIVPKFPCSKMIGQLSKLYSSTLSASSVSIGYKGVVTKLSTVFTLVSTALDLLEFKPDFYGYSQTNGDGKLINIPLSGKNNSSSASDWFAEAGYQHGIARYAAAMGAPVIECQ